MGMFDTIQLKEPLKVPGWAKPVSEIQTKHFGSVMMTYTLGSVLTGSPVRLGVVEDYVWCPAEEPGGEGRTHPVFFAIWHHILAGVYLNPDEAEERLRTLDRLDLIAWLEEAQRSARLWQSRYEWFRQDVRELHERLQEKDADGEGEDAEGERKQALRRICQRLPDEVITAPDPLQALLEAEDAKEAPKDAGVLSWF